jgi:hypothetical protein
MAAAAQRRLVQALLIPLHPPHLAAAAAAVTDAPGETGRCDCWAIARRDGGRGGGNWLGVKQHPGRGARGPPLTLPYDSPGPTQWVLFRVRFRSYMTLGNVVSDMQRGDVCTLKEGWSSKSWKFLCNFSTLRTVALFSYEISGPCRSTSPVGLDFHLDTQIDVQARTRPTSSGKSQLESA